MLSRWGAAALKALLEAMPVLANDEAAFRIQRRSSAMAAAPLAAADASHAVGAGPLAATPEAPPSAEPASSPPSPEQDSPQSSMPVMEASHRGSLILSVFVEPRSGRFRFRMSEEVLQFSETDYAAVIHAVRRQTVMSPCFMHVHLFRPQHASASRCYRSVLRVCLMCAPLQQHRPCVTHRGTVTVAAAAHLARAGCSTNGAPSCSDRGEGAGLPKRRRQPCRRPGQRRSVGRPSHGRPRAAAAAFARALRTDGDCHAAGAATPWGDGADAAEPHRARGAAAGAAPGRPPAWHAEGARAPGCYL